MSEDDVFGGFGIEVHLKDPDDFLIIRETLTRIGIQSSRKKNLFQSCMLLHKRGRYAIMHFKEMFALDGKESTICEDDILRRNTIAFLLDDWDLCEVEDKKKIKNRLELSKIKIVPYEDKSEWTLIQKYHFGHAQ